VSAGPILSAVGCFVVFGLLATMMGRSATADWREGQAADDFGTKFSAAGQWWPTILAALVAVVVPIILLTASS
jgi:hypothetical protein